MTSALAQWLIGAVVGAVIYISAIVFAVGRKYGKVETSLEAIQKAAKKVEKATERMERIPVLETKLDTLAAAQTEDRRRFNSIMPEVQSKITALWEKVFSLNEWRKSRPNINGGGE